jgi:hypothetical protein
MPPTPPLIRCTTLACLGILGSWRAGTLYPSSHLVPGRHIWAEADGTVILVCSLCGRQHRHGVRDGRLRPVASAC